jgi:hypothetical protein
VRAVASSAQARPTDSLVTGVPAPFQAGRDPVNLPVLRRWCDAVGVTNPLYTDPQVAARTRFGRIISPLALLDVWTKPGLAYQRNVEDPQGAAFEALDAEGYPSAVAVSSELVQHRPLVLGDMVTSEILLEAVSPEKSTALGRSRFVTTRQTFWVGEEEAGYSRFTVMRFAPAGDRRGGEAATPTPSGVGRGPADPVEAGVEVETGPIGRDATGTVGAAHLRPGVELPPVEIPVTATLIVSGALMTSDYFEAHHDRDAAVAKGSQDIFMNIHTSLGLLQAAVGDWLGPDVLWRSMAVRLGVPNYPGDHMVISAEVATVDPATGEVALSVRAVNRLGRHVDGRIEVTLPV